MGVTLLHFLSYNALPRNIVGCALSAPDGSSPRGYVWILVVKYRLKVYFFVYC
jgi:hypothetical protein